MESLEVEDAKQPFLHDRQNASTTPAHNPTRWKTWAYAFPPLVVLSLLCVWLVLRSSSAGDQVRPGELNEPRLSMVQRPLTGGLKYDDSGNLYRDTSSEAQSYVGNSSGVDDAWNVFDAIQTIELGVGAIGTERLYKDRRPMVITILDVFHQLHCLNKIRKALYNGEFLAEDNAKEKMHVEHCVDYIRQIIQCQSDLTPLELYYSEPAGRMMVDFEGPRVCRDFDQLTEWAWQHHATKVEIL